MISKLLTWGEDRSIAIARMKRALQEYRISGVKTTIPFCLAVMNHEAFVSGNYSTGFVNEYHVSGLNDPPEAVLRAMAAAAAVFHVSKKPAAVNSNSKAPGIGMKESGWVTVNRGER